MDDGESIMKGQYFTLRLRPKVNPELSLFPPKSVLFLPDVINGIRNGEIIIELIQNED